MTAITTKWMTRIACSVALVGGAAGCLSGDFRESDETGTTQQALGAQAYDGRTLFAGLMFHTGEVAKLFPEDATLPAEPNEQELEALEALEAQGVNVDELLHKKLSSGDRKALSKLQARVMDWIAESDAGFYARFAKSIQSGNQVAIRKSLGEGAKLLKKALEHELGVDFANLDPDLSKRSVILWVWAAVAVVAVVALVVVVPNVGGGSDSYSLAKDERVNRIADRLQLSTY